MQRVAAMPEDIIEEEENAWLKRPLEVKPGKKKISQKSRNEIK